MITRIGSRPNRWRPVRAEGGYILITTLVAMLLCMIVVSALLSLTADTVKIEETGRQRSVSTVRPKAR